MKKNIGMNDFQSVSKIGILVSSEIFIMLLWVCETLQVSNTTF